MNLCKIQIYTRERQMLLTVAFGFAILIMLGGLWGSPVCIVKESNGYLIFLH